MSASTSSPDALVGTLAQDQKVMVAVTRAVRPARARSCSTRSPPRCPRPEMARLAASLRAARKTGVAYIYVTHRLDEVFDLADRVTVLRDGRRVATADVADTTHDQLVSWILGDALEVGHRRGARSSATSRCGSTGGRSRSTCRPARSSAICGLIGSGSRDVARVLGGATTPEGSAELHGESVAARRPVRPLPVGRRLRARGPRPRGRGARPRRAREPLPRAPAAPRTGRRDGARRALRRAPA